MEKRSEVRSYPKFEPKLNDNVLADGSRSLLNPISVIISALTAAEGAEAREVH